MLTTQVLFKNFKWSLFVAIIGLSVGFMWGGTSGAITVALLSLLEVSFSVDNAVVNAKILKSMTPFWRFMFMTVGIAIAVFGMRLVFPVAIVSAISNLSMTEVTTMALQEPAQYAAILISVHPQISAFGGTFLMLVFLSFLLDEERESHWLAYAFNDNGHLKCALTFERVIGSAFGSKRGRLATDFIFNRNGYSSWVGWAEQKLTALGEKTGIAITLGGLIYFASRVPNEILGSVLISGIAGVILFVIIKTLAGTFENEEEGDAVDKTLQRTGIMAFMYLEVMDASFSFDGVIGAFALTNDVVTIMIGLAVGAMFVRSMTVYLVKQGTLDEYEYLEHGAMYAIGALSIIMLFSMTHHVPELVSGLIGAAFIAASVMSSISKKQSDAVVTA